MDHEWRNTYEERLSIDDPVGLIVFHLVSQRFPFTDLDTDVVEFDRYASNGTAAMSSARDDWLYRRVDAEQSNLGETPAGWFAPHDQVVA